MIIYHLINKNKMTMQRKIYTHLCNYIISIVLQNDNLSFLIVLQQYLDRNVGYNEISPDGKSLLNTVSICTCTDKNRTMQHPRLLCKILQQLLQEITYIENVGDKTYLPNYPGLIRKIPLSQVDQNLLRMHNHQCCIPIYGD